MTHRGTSEGQAGRAPDRRAFSLLETLIAGMILTTALIPIISNFQTLFRQYKKTHQATHALNIAQCILESVRYRLYNGDSRFFKLNDTTKERVKQLLPPARKYEEFFLALEDGVQVATGERGVRITQVEPRSSSKYFQEFMRVKGESQGITDRFNPVLFRQLDSYRAIVRVSFGAPKSLMDSEPNGSPEIDMCELEVMISFRDAGGVEQSQSLFTVVTRRQYNQFPDGQP